MIKSYEQIADDIRWKLCLIQSTNVSIRLKKRAIMDISDYLDEVSNDNDSVNRFFLCHVDSLYAITYTKFIKGFWEAMEHDENYELLHYLKNYFNTIIKG